MMRFLSVALCVALVLPLAAQQPNQGAAQADAGRRDRVQPQGRTFWKAELPGGNFVVAHAAIREVSTQQYVVDGAARVTEVNIDTGGQFKPRFYFLEPLATDVSQVLPAGGEVVNSLQNQAQAAASSASPGDPIWTKVVKNYPATTHAGTIEFRLETREQLDNLYQSVERSWINGKSETFTLEGVKGFRLTAKKKSDEADATGAPSDAGTDEN